MTLFIKRLRSVGEREEAETKEPCFQCGVQLGVAKRIEADEALLALSREFSIKRTVLYRWRDAYRKHGLAGLSRGPGRPRAPVRTTEQSALEAAARQTAELERKVGQQALQIDFLRRAFKRVEESRQRSTALGGTASTEKSGA